MRTSTNTQRIGSRCLKVSSILSASQSLCQLNLCFPGDINYVIMLRNPRDDSVTEGRSKLMYAGECGGFYRFL